MHGYQHLSICQIWSASSSLGMQVLCKPAMAVTANVSLLTPTTVQIRVVFSDRHHAFPQEDSNSNFSSKQRILNNSCRIYIRQLHNRHHGNARMLCWPHFRFSVLLSNHSFFAHHSVQSLPWNKHKYLLKWRIHRYQTVRRSSSCNVFHKERYVTKKNVIEVLFGQLCWSFVLENIQIMQWLNMITGGGGGGIGPKAGGGEL